MAILALDVGSSSVRAVLFNDSFDALTIARRLHQFTADGTSDAQHLRHLLESCVDEILTYTPSVTISAVGMATFAGNLIGVDNHNQPVTPILTYADRRSTRPADDLRQQLDSQQIQHRTGARIHPAYYPAQFMWIADHHPEWLTLSETWLDFGTYCYRAWFGHDVPMTVSLASWSGMLNRQTAEWDSEWLSILPIQQEQLPSLADFDKVQVGLTPEYAQRWSSLKHIPFHPAIGDGAAANIGTAGLLNEQTVLTMGTTSAIRHITPTSLTHLASGLWSYRLMRGWHLVGGALSEGGNIAAWMRQLDHSDEHNWLENEPGSHGLTVIPLLNGERSPNYNADAVGTIHGLQLNTTPQHIKQAMLESVALRLKLINQQLNPTNQQAILAGGGALQHLPQWTQLIADALNRTIYRVEVSEPTALGLAQLIADFQGHRVPSPNFDKMQRFEPRPEFARLYPALLDKQQNLYQRLYPNSESNS